jgi:hypothetical protein
MRIAPLVVLAALAGCGEDSAGGGSGVPDRPCTEIGCMPASVEVALSGLPDEPVAVTVCSDDRCSTIRGRGDQLTGVSTGMSEGVGDSVRVKVTVRSGRRVLTRQTGQIPVTTSRPNGPDCPPVCKIAQARLDVAGGRLEPA